MEEESTDDEHLDLRDVDSVASGDNPDINEGGATIQLSQLHSNSCRVSPATRRARNNAVLKLVQEHSTNRVRNVRSVAAKNLDKRCDADCIEIWPGRENIDEEADELEELTSEVVGLALRGAFVFWNDDEDYPSDTEINHPRVTPGPAEKSDQFDCEDEAARRPAGAESEPIESISPTQHSSRQNRKSPNVTSRRSGVDVTLFAAYITLSMLLLSDPIQAEWGDCDVATEAWLRNLCFLLMQLSASMSLEQLELNLATVQRAAGSCLGQCSSFLRFVAELCSLLGRESSTWNSNRVKVSLLLSQSAARLRLLALRQCRLFSRVSATFSSESAAAYSKSFEKLGFRWSLPWSVNEARRSGHMYPGRRPVRPGINFTGRHGNACSKEYAASSGPSPGVAVVICVCGNKIVLGFSLLARKESLSIIASILLRYSPDVRIVFYDAACNFFSSIVNMLLWFAAGVRAPRFLIDVFYKLCYTCGVCFCAKTQMNDVGAHRDPRTSNVESADKQLAFIKKSFLRVRSSNAMSILAIRFLFIDLLSRWRMKTGSDDTEDADLGAIFSRFMQCRCRRCKKSRNAPGEEGENFALREPSMHASVTEKKTHNAGSSARNATAYAQEEEGAQLSS